jgi:hypothetical protein
VPGFSLWNFQFLLRDRIRTRSGSSDPGQPDGCPACQGGDHRITAPQKGAAWPLPPTGTTQSPKARRPKAYRGLTHSTTSVEYSSHLIGRPQGLTKPDCHRGGIGRRAWFRSTYSQGCGGSSPFDGTIQFKQSALNQQGHEVTRRKSREDFPWFNFVTW